MRLREQLRKHGHLNPADVDVDGRKAVQFAHAEDGGGAGGGGDRREREGGGGRDREGKGGAEGSGADEKVTFKPLGTLLVTVIGAIGLKEKGLSPYCDMRFGNQHARTTVQKDSMAPVLNQTGHILFF